MAEYGHGMEAVSEPALKMARFACRGASRSAMI